MNDEDKDNFAAAFADAIAGDKPAADNAHVNAVADSVAEDAANPAAEIQPVIEASAVPPEPQPNAEAPAPVPEPEPKPVAAPAPVVPQAEVQPPKQVIEEPVFPDPVLSAEHQKAIDQLKKDWPDIAEAMEAKVQHVTAAQEAKFSRALVDVVKRMYNDIAPMADIYAETAQSKFRATVVDKHKDFDEVQPKLQPWIEQQPGYLKKAYQQAYDGGTAEEIVDLVQRFKDANGVKPQMPDPAPKPKVDEKKVESLAPVGGKRPVVATKGVDPNDYKGAFSEATNSL